MFRAGSQDMGLGPASSSLRPVTPPPPSLVSRSQLPSLLSLGKEVLHSISQTPRFQREGCSDPSGNRTPRLGGTGALWVWNSSCLETRPYQGITGSC